MRWRWPDRTVTAKLLGLALVLVGSLDLHPSDGRHGLGHAAVSAGDEVAAACSHGPSHHLESPQRVVARDCPVCLQWLSSRAAIGTDPGRPILAAQPWEATAGATLPPRLPALLQAAPRGPPPA